MVEDAQIKPLSEVAGELGLVDEVIAVVLGTVETIRLAKPKIKVLALLFV